MIAILWLAACGGDATENPGDRVADYAPREGWTYLFAPRDLPDSVPLLLRVDGASWTFRTGEHWDDADPVAELDWSLEGSLVVDGTVLLPDPVEVGAHDGEATVVTIEQDHEVRYGIFPRAAIVEVDSGDWLGEHAFAQGYGPIALSWSGQAWELVRYDPE